MKLIHKIFAAAASILALSSCVQDAIGPLTGEYAKPVTYELNTLVKNEVTVDQSTRTFNVVLTDNAATLDMKFVGNKYFLPDNGYTAATADAAKNGTYIVGNGGSTFTVNGNTVGVDSGTLNVKQTDGVYTFKGTLWLADESVIAVNSAVAIVYEADPEPVKLTTLLSATSNVASGTNSLTINLGTDGISSTTDPTTWQTVWTGTGNYLALDIYSEDGYLHEGTYTACATGGAINPGEFGIGWDPGDLWGIGMVFENWGTCWWNVAGGAAVAAGKVTDGTVQVLVEGTDLVIKLKSTLVNAKFTYPVAQFVDGTGAPIEVVNLGGGEEPEFEGTELSVLLSATSNVANGTNSVTINLAEEGITSTQDPNTWQTTWEGEGHYLALDVYSADGKLAPGTYTACATGGTIAGSGSSATNSNYTAGQRVKKGDILFIIEPTMYIDAVVQAQSALQTAKADLEYAENNSGVEAFNLGTGNGVSVMELVHAFDEANDMQLPYVIGPRREGDLPAFWADAEKAKKLLGWEATHTVEDMCRSAWNFIKNAK